MIGATILLGALSLGSESIDTAKQAIQKGVSFLKSAQNENGSFGSVRNVTFTSSFGNAATYHCWQLGASALATQALLQCGSDPECRRAVEKGLDYIVANAKVLRPAQWDLDNNWSLIYGLTAVCAGLRDPEIAKSPRAESLREAGKLLLAGMKQYQGARGGWGYYADPDAAWRPDWGTSFTTAAAVLALIDAGELGFEVDAKMRSTAIRALERSRLPNGAIDYDIGAVPRHLSMESINQVKGSLGRIQVVNHALLRAGIEVTDEDIEQGVARFFEHHEFLDVARNKPIPHEAYYQNAAYFYLFGHYYAAFTIDRLPKSERSEAFEKLRHEILKCQQPDGSYWDFWIADLSRSYGTAFAIMALDHSLVGETQE